MAKSSLDLLKEIRDDKPGLFHPDRGAILQGHVDLLAAKIVDLETDRAEWWKSFEIIRDAAEQIDSPLYKNQLARAQERILAFEFALVTSQCPACKGTKGFYDTTYTRAGGDWENCKTCGGHGDVFDIEAIRKVAALIKGE